MSIDMYNKQIRTHVIKQIVSAQLRWTVYLYNLHETIT